MVLQNRLFLCAVACSRQPSLHTRRQGRTLPTPQVKVAGRRLSPALIGPQTSGRGQQLGATAEGWVGRECPGPAPTSLVLGMNWDYSLGRVKRYPEQGYCCCCRGVPGGSAPQLLGNLLPEGMPPIAAVGLLCGPPPTADQALVLLCSPHTRPAEHLLRDVATELEATAGSGRH